MAAYERWNECVDRETGSTKVSEMWHRRFGHLNGQYLSQMARDGVVRGIEKINNRGLNCVVCAKCKISESPYPKQSERKSRQILDLVHISK